MARSTPHMNAVNPFTTEYMMASGKVAPTFESVDEILKCNHSNETSFTWYYLLFSNLQNIIIEILPTVDFVDFWQ